MAFQTGNFASGDDFDAVHAKLKAFATAQGWTTAGSYPSLVMSKGTINAILNFDITPMVDDTLKSGGAAHDYCIKSYLSKTTGGSQPYPNSMVGFQATSNDWTGPYSRYWLFSGGANDPDYIYMVVQKANGNFCTWMVGKVDNKGVNYGGGEFIQGVYWNWWFGINTGVGPYNGSGQGSDAFNNHAWPGDANQSYNFKVGDTVAAQLDPTQHLDFAANFSNGPPNYFPGVNGLVPLLSRGGKPTALESYGTFNLRWLGHIYWLGPNPVNGLTPLFELPCMLYSGYQEIGHMIYLGTYPGYRACSMVNRTEAEHITYGSDEWIVFPIKRFQPYVPEPFAAKSVTSGPYAHAFKINN